jgi:hypothetical protein
MRIHEMTTTELCRAVRDGTALAVRIGRTDPLIADLLLDATGLALQELMVHACGGDREEAERRFRRARSGSRQ